MDSTRRPDFGDGLGRDHGHAAYLKIDGLGWAGLATGQAGDAFVIIRVLIEVDPHGADRMADLALGAPFAIEPEPDQLHPGEECVKGA
jgi:hypothetical protein